MKHIVIRDDDMNALSSPELLDQVYGPMLSSCLPLSAAVVPEVASAWDWQTSERNRISPQAAVCAAPPMIPIEQQGGAQRHRLSAKSPVALWLRRHADQVEVLQHGLSHAPLNGWFEFDHDDKPWIMDALARGKDILETALGAAPRGFVPPWDVISGTGLECVRQQFNFISVSRLWNPRRAAGTFKRRVQRRAWDRAFHPWRYAWAFFQQWLEGYQPFAWGSLSIFSHPGYLLSRDMNEEIEILPLVEAAIERLPVTVLVNHHWEYVDARGAWRKDRLRAWHKVIGTLRQRTDIRFTSFAGLLESMAGPASNGHPARDEKAVPHGA